MRRWPALLIALLPSLVIFSHDLFSPPPALGCVSAPARPPCLAVLPPGLATLASAAHAGLPPVGAAASDPGLPGLSVEEGLG